MATPTELMLMERIVRAKVALEGARKPHTCIIDDDPDYMGPCKCGASEQNAAISKALRELDLSK